MFLSIINSANRINLRKYLLICLNLNLVLSFITELAEHKLLVPKVSDDNTLIGRADVNGLFGIRATPNVDIEVIRLVQPPRNVLAFLPHESATTKTKPFGQTQFWPLVWEKSILGI